MKNIVIIVGVIIVAVAAGAGGYALMSRQDKNASTTSNTTKEQPTQEVAKDNKVKELNLDTTLADIKSEVPTVTESYVYSETRDPNGNLGKVGFYTSGANFCDSRTEVNPAEDDPSGAFGADCGGAIEVYANTDDAAKRMEYFKQFEGNAMLSPGASEQIDHIVIRASSKLSASEQTALLQTISSQVKKQL